MLRPQLLTRLLWLLWERAAAGEVDLALLGWPMERQMNAADSVLVVQVGLQLSHRVRMLLLKLVLWLTAHALVDVKAFKFLRDN